MKWARLRKLTSGDLNSFVSKVAGVAIVFIIIVKTLELVYLRKKLKDKKML